MLRSEGFYVPILPPKRSIEKFLNAFSPDFIRQRKVELELWMQNLAEQHAIHPGAKDPQTHPYYRQFLIEGANRPPQPLIRVFPEHMETSYMADAKPSEKDVQSKQTKV